MKENIRLEMENELLLTKTKAQMINMYLDELEKNKIIEKRLLEFEDLLTDTIMGLHSTVDKCDDIDLRSFYYARVYILEWIREKYLNILKGVDNK